jgi:hypothetical protein
MADLGYDGIRITALELQCRGLKALERWDDLLRVAEGALTLATPVNFRAMEWRLRAHTAYALTHLNRQDEAEAAKSQAVAILESITATIPDPAHAQQFCSQPLAKQLYEPFA